MRKLNGKAYACIALLAAVFLAAGCGIFDSDDGKSSSTSDPPAEYMDLTSPDNLLYNLTLSYAELNIEEYAALLLNTYDGDYGREYYWYFQEEDVTKIGEYYWDRQTDIQATNNLFLAASGMPVKPEHPVIDRLVLEISMYPPWAVVDSLWGEPCEDCWYTKRAYYIKILIGEDTVYGDNFVKFYVVPVQEGDVTTYRIALAIDVRE